MTAEVVQAEGNPNPLHVYPLNDLREHVIEGYGENCWCNIRVEDGIVIHTSMDGREKFETGERKVS